jgi:hypothetical protein
VEIRHKATMHIGRVAVGIMEATLCFPLQGKEVRLGFLKTPNASQMLKIKKRAEFTPELTRTYAMQKNIQKQKCCGCLGMIPKFLGAEKIHSMCLWS